ncbi:NnrU family protein [Roseibium sp.]|uniref:NnrU family protein n=1 Tax=Roseibium sp. TaxID=1936156 RepID=UPI003B500C8D
MVWGELVLAFGNFVLFHSVPLRPPVRGRVEKVTGKAGFTIVYSILSIVLLGWLLLASGRAPYVQLWPWAAWQSRLAMVIMFVACLLLALGFGRPNPFSFGGRNNNRFDAQSPGLVRYTRHPLLLALGFWGGAHVIANGDLAHFLVFASLTIFAFFGGRIIDRRKKREMGEEWFRLKTEVSRQPLLAPRGVTSAVVLRCLAGVALFASLLHLHPYLFGVSPWTF